MAASAALLEALIPPSNAAILFSALTNVPVSQTFAAGIIPGLILLLFMIAIVLIKCRDIAGTDKATGMERLAAAKKALPALITPIIILGGIYAGLLTPSESAAIAGLWAVIMGFIIYRELTIEGLLKCLKETAAITAVIFSIIATATFLSVVLTYTQLPQKIISFFTDMGAGIYVFWFSLALICLILGTFIEITSKSGSSPFKFDNIDDDLKLNLNLNQQIIKSLSLGVSTYLNIDKDSDKFSKFINTKYSLNWNRRAYNLQLYYEQDTKNAGLNFTIFGLPFNGLGKEF